MRTAVRRKRVPIVRPDRAHVPFGAGQRIYLRMGVASNDVRSEPAADGINDMRDGPRPSPVAVRVLTGQRPTTIAVGRAMRGVRAG